MSGSEAAHMSANHLAIWCCVSLATLALPSCWTGGDAGGGGAGGAGGGAAGGSGGGGAGGAAGGSGGGGTGGTDAGGDGGRDAGRDSAACQAAPETCNGRDDDCDGRVDENGSIWCEENVIRHAPAVCSPSGNMALCFSSGPCEVGYDSCDGDPANGCEAPECDCNPCDDAG